MDPAKKKKHDFFQFLRDYWEITRGQHRSILWAAVLINLQQVFAVVEPLFVNAAIQDYMRGVLGGNGYMPGRSVYGKLGMAALVLLIQAKMVQRKARRVREIVTNLDHGLRLGLMEKLLRLGGPFHEANNTTALYSTISKGIKSVGDISFQFAQELLPLFTMFVVTSLAVGWYSPLAALAILPIVAIFTHLTVSARAAKLTERRKRHALDRETDRLFGAAVAFVRTVWTFGQERRELARLADTQEQAKAILIDEYGLYDRVDVWRSLCIGIGRIGVVLLCFWQGLHDPGVVANIVLVYLLSDRLFRACYSIGNVYDRFTEASELVVEGIMNVSREPVLIKDPERPLPLETVRGEIVLRDATFRYGASTGKPALDGLTFTINAGETVGIVGESGGGKSTLVKVLMRFVDLVSGQALLDGVSLTDLSLPTLRSAIGYVSQEIEVFDGTVAENIAYGRPGASRDEIVAAAERAHAHDFIMGFADGYETRVGERGLRLSGGQRQRIGIARVFLMNPPIILLDEATASVDVGSDAYIHRSITELAATGKTVIIIAHRLATVQNADRVFYLRDGRLIESGRPADLIRDGGAYAQMHAVHETFGRTPTTEDASN